MAPTVETLAEIISVWKDAEAEITRLVAAAVRTDALGTAAHYRGQQESLRAVLAAVEELFNRAAGATTTATRDLILAEYATSVQNAITAGGGPIPQSVPTAAVENVVAETLGAIGSVRSNILRDTADAYRDIMGTVATRQLTSGMTKDKALQQALNLFADKGITGFVDRAGRRWNIASYTDMAIRTAVNRAGNRGRMDGYVEAGVELIRVSSHRGCAPQCLPFQGRLLALEGKRGKRKIKTAWGETVTVEVVATMEEALRNGYHHPNCRHTDTPYSPGAPEPEIDESTEEDYEAEQRQRAIERHIRHWKKREAVAISPTAKADARAKVKAWQTAQRAHLKDNPWLSRRYNREQMKVGVTGVTHPALKAAPAVPAKPLDLPDGFKHAPTPIAVALKANKAEVVGAAAKKLTNPSAKWESATSAPYWATVVAANGTNQGLVNAAHRLLRAEEKLTHAKAMKAGKAFSPFADKDALAEHVKGISKATAAERKGFVQRLQADIDPVATKYLAETATPGEVNAFAAEHTYTVKHLVGKKQPFSGQNADSLAKLYTTGKLGTQAALGDAVTIVAPEALQAARNVFLAKQRLKLTELLDDTAATATAKASVSAANKAMAATAKEYPDGLLMKALEVAGHKDKTFLALAKKQGLIADALDTPAKKTTTAAKKATTATKETPGPLGTTTAGTPVPPGVNAETMEYMVALKLHGIFGSYDKILADMAAKAGVSTAEINAMVNAYVSHAFKHLGATEYLMTPLGKKAAAQAAEPILKQAVAWGSKYKTTVPKKAKAAPATAKPKQYVPTKDEPSAPTMFNLPAAKAPDLPVAKKPEGVKYTAMPAKFKGDEALNYAAALRAAGFHKDLMELVDEFAAHHDLRPSQVHFWIAKIESDRFKWDGPVAERPKSFVEAELELKSKGKQKYVGGKLKAFPNGKFKETAPDVLDFRDLEAARHYAERIWETYKDQTPAGYAKPLTTYTTSKYSSINNAERKTLGATPYDKKLRDELDKAFDMAPRNPDTIIVRRGTGHYQFTGGHSPQGGVSENPESWVGKTFTDYGYMSTSIGGEAAFDSKPVVMTIKVPAGNKMAYVAPGVNQRDGVISRYPHENEIILQRQTQFRVLSVRVDGNQTFVDAEVIGQNA